MDIRLATASIKSSKVRSILTMFAVIVGVTGFVLVTTFIDGLKATIGEQISTYGDNLITVNSGDLTVTNDEGEIVGFNPLASLGGVYTLTEKDLSDIQALEGVEVAAPQMMVSASGTLTRKDNTYKGVFVIATNSQFPSSFNQKLAIGSFFTDEDNENGRKVTVIGSSLAEEMFPGGFGLGAQIEFKRQKFTVIGVLSEIEASSVSFGFDVNRMMLIPLEVGKSLNGGIASIQEIDIQAVNGTDVDKTVENIKALLLDNHGGEKDFTVLKQDQLVELTDSLLNYVKTASQVLAFVMLFVGGVVIALIMLITVKERTREIGIRKSIGGTNSNILMQFLVEAVVISWLGSLVGIILAYGIGLYIAGVSDITPVYTLRTLVTVVIIATLIGAISGIIPAFLAARKDPVEALRDE